MDNTGRAASVLVATGYEAILAGKLRSDIEVLALTAQTPCRAVGNAQQSGYLGEPALSRLDPPDERSARDLGMC